MLPVQIKQGLQVAQACEVISIGEVTVKMKQLQIRLSWHCFRTGLLFIEGLPLSFRPLFLTRGKILTENT